MYQGQRLRQTAAGMARVGSYHSLGGRDHVGMIGARGGQRYGGMSWGWPHAHEAGEGLGSAKSAGAKRRDSDRARHPDPGQPPRVSMFYAPKPAALTLLKAAMKAGRPYSSLSAASRVHASLRPRARA